MIVRLGCESVRDELKQPVRVIQLKATEQTQYSAHTLVYKGRKPPETMLICTDMLDLDADVIALIYRCRWQVEIFFRFFKHILGCRHLLSYCDNGIELQVYAGIIACLLIALYTGKKPTLRTYEMFCWYLTGWADDEELAAHIGRLKKQTTD
jgi:IS4 transposase